MHGWGPCVVVSLRLVGLREPLKTHESLCFLSVCRSEVCNIILQQHATTVLHPGSLAARKLVSRNAKNASGSLCSLRGRSDDADAAVFTAADVRNSMRTWVQLPVSRLRIWPVPALDRADRTRNTLFSQRADIVEALGGGICMCTRSAWSPDVNCRGVGPTPA